MELGALMPYDGESFFEASLGEPMSCIIGTFHAMYHTSPGSYEHRMGIVEGGKLGLPKQLQTPIPYRPQRPLARR